ncbi:MAG: rRNA maturation RNase YbeY [Phycisphaerae bacterium]|nr:rRNA maturation RNase YbeY [Phycisphaerae bacterium]
MPPREPHLAIDLTHRQSSFRLDRRRAMALARHVLRAEGVANAEVEIAIVGDREMARLNMQYLGHRGTTDVLSFNLSDDEPRAEARGRAAIRKSVLGQLIVCSDVARRRAKELGHSIVAELLFYVAHGLLHLLDYDDATPAGRQRMHDRQRELLARFGLRLKG